MARARRIVPDRHLPALCMVGTALLWGTAPVVTKLALESLTPFVLSASRWTISVTVMCLILARSGSRPVLSRRVAAAGLLGMVTFTVLFSYGVQRTTAANTTLIGAALPMLIALLAASFLGEAITRNKAAGIALSIVGVAVIVGGASVAGSLTGNLLVSGATVSFAVFTVISRDLVAGHNPLAITAGTAIVGLAVFAPAAVGELRVGEQAPLTWMTVATVVYLALGPSMCSYLLYGYALSRMPASQVGVWSNLVPVVGVTAAAIALGEPITLPHLAGGALVLAGVFLGNRRPSRR